MDDCLAEIPAEIEWSPACVDCVLEMSCTERWECADRCTPGGIDDDEGGGPGGAEAEDWEE